MKVKAILFLILPTAVLYASYNYVIVTKAKNKRQLSSIKHKLDRLGLNTLYKKQRNNYIVYSGPYRRESLSKVLSRVDNYFPYARVSTIKVNRKTRKKISNQHVQNSNIVKNVDNGFLLGLSTGYSYAPTTHSIKSGTVIIDEPKNSGLSYILNGGYHFKNDFTLSLNYMYFDASDIEFSNIYASVDYRLKSYDNITPYFGLLSGYSNLVWNKNPVTTVNTVSQNKSDSYFLGTQAGVMYNLSKPVSYFIKYQCIFMEHTTNIDTSTATTTNLSKLQHTTLHSLNLGIQYNF